MTVQHECGRRATTLVSGKGAGRPVPVVPPFPSLPPLFLPPFFTHTTLFSSMPFPLPLVARASRSVLRGHTGWVNDAAALRGGSQALTASGDGTARLWDLRTGKCLHVLQAHTDDVTCLMPTSRGRFVVTGSADGTAQVWDLTAQDVLAAPKHDGRVRLLAAC